MSRFKRTKMIGRKDSGRRHSGSRDFDKRDHEDRRPSRREFDRSDSGRRAPGKEYKGFKNRRDLEITTVTCASCGVKCDVPFKPTSDKPVYCRDCFAKNKGGSDSRRSYSKEPSSGISKEDIEKINRKLDKILRALDVD